MMVGAVGPRAIAAVEPLQIRSRSPSGMPGPRSETRTSTLPSTARAATLMRQRRAGPAPPQPCPNSAVSAGSKLLTPMRPVASPL